MRKIMIYLGDENLRQDTCSSAEDCVRVCNLEPGRCKSPEAGILRKEGGIWSRESENNPFSQYFKVRLNVFCF